MMSDITRIPTLRFSGFHKEWVNKKLKDVCFRIMDGTHFSPKSKTGTKLYLTSKNIRNDGLDLSQVSYISEEEHYTIYKRCPVKIGDVLLTKDGANTGNCCINSLTQEFSLLSSVAVIDGKKEELLNSFLLQILQSPKGIDAIKNTMAGQAITRITLEKINNFRFDIPDFPEQQKIASFLTTVNEKIQGLKRKKSLLEQYKKGVMQQLFSQEIRFKDENGNDYPDWETVKLKDIGIKINKKNKDGLCNRVLTNSATEGIVLQESYFDREIANQDNLLGYYLVDVNDFVYNPRISSSAPVGPINKNKIILGVMSPLYTIFRFNIGCKEFYEKYFQTSFWHEYMKSTANTGARHDRMNVSNEDFFNLPIPYPSLPEQTKIANFLSAIDEKIEKEDARIKQAEQWKKGLLQQLFV